MPDRTACWLTFVFQRWIYCLRAIHRIVSCMIQVIHTAKLCEGTVWEIVSCQILCDASILRPQQVPVLGWIRSLVIIMFFCRRRHKSLEDLESMKRRETIRLESNIPLSISLFLSSYIASLNRRKLADGVILSGLLASLDGMGEALTAL